MSAAQLAVPKVRCDNAECAKVFNVRLHEREQVDGGRVMYYACPHCQHEYPLVEISKVGVALRKAMRELRASKQFVPEELTQRYQEECKRL